MRPIFSHLPIRFLMLAAIVVVVAVRFAEPIADSDYFFHLVYGEWILQNHSLSIDHSIFSWTPADSAYRYCAWIAQIVLYLLHEFSGVAGVFVVRYLAIAASVLLILRFAKKQGRENEPLTYLLLLVFLLASFPGTLQKPVLFSFLLINLFVFWYFDLKSDWEEFLETQVSEARKHFPGRWKIYVFPVMLLLWVNTHGAYIFGLGFLILAAVGELMNELLARGPRADANQQARRERRSILRHLFWSVLLSLVAVGINPFGWWYLFDILELPFRTGQRPETGLLDAYQTIFSGLQPLLHLVELFVLMSLGIVVAIIASAGRKGGRIDFAIVLLNIFFAVLFVRFVRATYLWTSVFVFSLLLLKPGLYGFLRGRMSRVLNAAVVLVFLLGAARAVHEARAFPFTYRWMGFGIGYSNPVIESEFVKKFRPGTLLFNDYDSGAYLMWNHRPDYRVFIDARAFPYLESHSEYFDFVRGNRFVEFTAKYPFDIAIVNLGYRQCIVNFHNSPEWKLAFFGPTAAVFVKSDTVLPESTAEFRPDRFENLKNPFRAGAIAFAYDLTGDYEALEKMLRSNIRKEHPPNQNRYLEALIEYYRQPRNRIPRQYPYRF